jgi:hypothetical protein
VVDRGQRADAQVRVDRPDPLGDVAHVGRGGRHPPRPGLGQVEVAAEGGPVGGEERRQLLVVAELGVARAGLGQLPLAPGRERARLEAGPHPGEGAVELGQRAGADVPGAAGQVGDRVGGAAGLGDDAVHADRRCQLLAEQADGDLRDRERVGRVAAELRVGAGVGGDAPVGDVEVRHRLRPGVDGVGRARVDHHREREVVEAPGVQQRDLPAAALFGRGADDADADAEVGGDAGEGLGGAHGGGGDDVVAAGVAEAGQGVVLGDEADGGDAGAGAGAVLGDERGGQAVDPALDREAAGGELVRQQRRRGVFPPGGLGVLVQSAADGQQGVEPLVDRLGDLLLERFRSPGRGHRSPGTP